MTYDEMAEAWMNGNISAVMAEIAALPSAIDGFLCCKALVCRQGPWSGSRS